eukprot:4144655-Pyramimonas_sp.AAC.1
MKLPAASMPLPAFKYSSVRARARRALSNVRFFLHGVDTVYDKVGQCAGGKSVRGTIIRDPSFGHVRRTELLFLQT